MRHRVDDVIDADAEALAGPGFGIVGIVGPFPGIAGGGIDLDDEHHAAIDDRQVFVAEGTGASQSPVKLFFDNTSGLLVRQVRYVRVPVGSVAVQVDCDDYREVPGTGVKVPFRWTAAWTDGPAFRSEARRGCSGISISI